MAQTGRPWGPDSTITRGHSVSEVSICLWAASLVPRVRNKVINLDAGNSQMRHSLSLRLHRWSRAPVRRWSTIYRSQIPDRTLRRALQSGPTSLPKPDFSKPVTVEPPRMESYRGRLGILRQMSQRLSRSPLRLARPFRLY